jgi:transcriptional regulator with GAF, ATPase, and Fis domain
LSETLLETELFGHVRGSFTGAYRDRAGVFELAHRGTVFMDEIGETSARMQGMLLRFLETGEVQRVGSDDPHTIADVRVIAATNRVLAESVKSGQFREDLFYRLNIINIAVPPLRERPEDIPALLDHFLQRFSAKYQMRRPVFLPAALTVLQQHSWPGNVRELKNVVERLVARSLDRDIGREDLPPEIASLASASAAGPASAFAFGFGATASGVGAVSPGVSLADTLYDRVVRDRENFWGLVHASFMSRDLTRADLRAIVHRGLTQTSGNYRLVVELFGMPPSDYKRFLSFLRKYQCHMPFQPFRSAAMSRESDPKASSDPSAPHNRIAASV